MSGPSENPSPFNVEFLRKDAKHLLRACRSGDTAALARVRAALPRLAMREPERAAAAVTLADVQHAIAREHGCVNWAALKRAGDPLERLLVAVRGGASHTIASSIGDFTGLARESVHAACALGDADALVTYLNRDPSIATVAHRGWPPIAYACASPVHRLGGRYAAGLLACVTALLDLGVDPNTATVSESVGDERLIPVAYRAIRNQNTAVYLLLLRRGADERMLQPFRDDLIHDIKRSEWQDVVDEYLRRPDVRDTLMNSLAVWRASHPSLQGHVTPLDLRDAHVTAWAQAPFALPWLEVPRWSLPVDRPGSMDAILTVVTHTGPLPLVELLLDRGFDPDTRHSNGRSLVAMTIRAGRNRVAELLRSRGASPADVTPADELIGACLRLDAARARAIVRDQHDVLSSLTAADFDVLASAARGSIDHLRLMLDLGIPASGRGTGDVTALHLAAWHGCVDAVRLLIERGAPVDARDVTYRQTPLEWAVHGSTHCRTAEDEYREVMKMIGR